MHKKLAKILSILTLLITLSGLILLHKEDILHSSLCKPNSKIIPLNEIQNQVNTFNNITNISFYSKPCNFYVINFKNQKAKYYNYASKKEINSIVIHLVEYISDFHRSLFLSKYLLSIIGILWILLILSGIYLVFKFSYFKLLKKNKFSLSKKTHIIIGLIISPVIIIIILTGTVLPINKYIINIFSNKNNIQKKVIFDNISKNNFIQSYETIKNMIKESKITRIYFSNKMNNISFRYKMKEDPHPYGKSYIKINNKKHTLNHIKYINKQVEVKILENIYTIHSGKYFNYLITTCFILFLFMIMIL